MVCSEFKDSSPALINMHWAATPRPGAPMASNTIVLIGAPKHKAHLLAATHRTHDTHPTPTHLAPLQATQTTPASTAQSGSSWTTRPQLPPKPSCHSACTNKAPTPLTLQPPVPHLPRRHDKDERPVLLMQGTLTPKGPVILGNALPLFTFVGHLQFIRAGTWDSIVHPQQPVTGATMMELVGAHLQPPTAPLRPKHPLAPHTGPQTRILQH
jgi:hypothetical protein